MKKYFHFFSVGAQVMRAPAQKDHRKMRFFFFFLSWHSIKTDIIMRIVFYLFWESRWFLCLFRLFWHCHGIYVSLENLGISRHNMTATANLCESAASGLREKESQRLRVHWILMKTVYFYHFRSFELGRRVCAFTSDFFKEITNNSNCDRESARRVILMLFIFRKPHENMVK